MSVVKEIETRRVLDFGVQKLHGRRVHGLSESRARLQGQSRHSSLFLSGVDPEIKEILQKDYDAGELLTLLISITT
jgi:hypothetical protein